MRGKMILKATCRASDLGSTETQYNISKGFAVLVAALTSNLIMGEYKVPIIIIGAATIGVGMMFYAIIKGMVGMHCFVIEVNPDQEQILIDSDNQNILFKKYDSQMEPITLIENVASRIRSSKVCEGESYLEFIGTPTKDMVELIKMCDKQPRIIWSCRKVAFTVEVKGGMDDEILQKYVGAFKVGEK